MNYLEPNGGASFRDTIPYPDEIPMEREGFYTDPTAVPEIEDAIEKGYKDELAIRYAQFIREKMYGSDVRESIARFGLWLDVRINEIEKQNLEVIAEYKEIKNLIEDLEAKFDLAINGLTIDSELILSRYSKMLKKQFNIFGDRADFWDIAISGSGVPVSIFNNVEESKRLEFAINFCIENNFNLLLDTDIETDDIIIDSSPSKKIFLDFNKKTIKPSVSSYNSNEFLITFKKNKNIFLDNVLIDCLDKKNKGINFDKTEMESGTISVENLSLGDLARGAVIATQVVLSEDFSMKKFEANNLSGKSDGVIGDWDGMVKGLSVTSESDISTKKIYFGDLYFSEISSRDGDGLHLSGLEKNIIKIDKVDGFNCDSRLVKIQNSWGSEFQSIKYASDKDRPNRRGVICDYSGGNSFNEIIMKEVWGVHGLEIYPSAPYLHFPKIGYCEINCASEEESLDGEFVSPVLISKINKTDVLKNYYFGVFRLTAKHKGFLQYTAAINTTYNDFLTFGNQDTYPSGITIDAPFSNDIGLKASLVNCQFKKIVASSTPLYITATTTRRLSNVDKLQTFRDGNDPYLAVTNLDTGDLEVAPREFLRIGEPKVEGMTNYRVGDRVYIKEPLAGHSIYGYICIKAGNPGEWKPLKY